MNKLDIEHVCAVGAIIGLADAATAVNLGAPMWVAGTWLAGAVACLTVVAYYELQSRWLRIKFYYYTKDLRQDRARRRNVR